MQLEHILMAHGLIGRGGGKSKDNIPPPPITNFIAIVVGDSIKLTWTNPMDTDFVGVRIVRKVGSYPSSTSDGMIIYEGNLTTFTDNDITLGVVHYYRAFTYDFDNNYNHDTGQQTNAIVKISQTAPVPALYSHPAIVFSVILVDVLLAIVGADGAVCSILTITLVCCPVSV